VARMKNRRRLYIDFDFVMASKQSLHYAVYRILDGREPLHTEEIHESLFINGKTNVTRHQLNNVLGKSAWIEGIGKPGSKTGMKWLIKKE
jgi:hypothetical protein